MSTTPTASGDRETYRCRVCGREFENTDALERHVRDQGLRW